MSENFSAIIVGAGHNGLVAANYLSRGGAKVLVLERREMVGGACVTEELFPGFQISSCSYICHLLQKKVIQDLQLEKYGFEILALDPTKFQPFPGGHSLKTYHDDQRTKEQIRRFSRRDADRFADWCQFWTRASGLLFSYFLEDPPTRNDVAAAVRGTDNEEMLDALLKGNMKDLVEQYFEHPMIQAAFIDAYDTGDIRAPGSIMTVAYHKCARFTDPKYLGIPRGGMGGITRAMADSARASGVDIRTGVEVERIDIQDGKVTGVLLEDGERLEADVVLSNADPKRTFLTLVDPSVMAPEFTESIRQLQTKFGTLKFHATLRELPDFSQYLGKDHDPREIAQIRICPSVEYFERSWNAACLGKPSRCPIMTIQIPTVMDDSLTPSGCHIMSIWSQYAPSQLAEGSWDDVNQNVGEHLIATLAEYAPNVPNAIMDWVLYTPADLQQRAYLTDGNIHHVDIVLSQLWADRPNRDLSGYRTPIDGLYLCGAGTHPGGEVTAAPGHNAARVVLRDQAV